MSAYLSIFDFLGTSIIAQLGYSDSFNKTFLLLLPKLLNTSFVTSTQQKIEFQFKMHNLLTG